MSKRHSKHEHFNKDLENIMTIISNVDANGSVQTHSIRNHFCLLKFKNSSQMQGVDQGPFMLDPLDLLTWPVSFLRGGQQPFSIKPDMSPMEHSRDSILMKDGL